MKDKKPTIEERAALVDEWERLQKAAFPCANIEHRENAPVFREFAIRVPFPEIVRDLLTRIKELEPTPVSPELAEYLKGVPYTADVCTEMIREAWAKLKDARQESRNRGKVIAGMEKTVAHDLEIAALVNLCCVYDVDVAKIEEEKEHDKD